MARAKGTVAVPISDRSSRLIHAGLRAAGVRIVSALPETALVHVIRLIEEDAGMRLVRLAKEEEGIGISAGAHLAGARSALLMQNHGFFQSVNGIVSLALLYKIPLLMLISDRGHLGERDSWQTEGGKHTRRVLDALGIVRDDLSSAEHVERKIVDAMTLAQSSLSPVALLLARGLMWEEA